MLKLLHLHGGSINRPGKKVVHTHRRLKLAVGNKTPLHYASENNHRHVVKYLLANDAQSSVQDLDGNTPLHLACKLGHVSVVEEFVRPGIPWLKNKNGATAFHVATDVHVLTLLKTAGAQLHQPNQSGPSPLHESAETPALLATLQWFILNGADVNETHRNQGTPLHVACYNGNLPGMELLLTYGASVNTKDSFGATALHKASVHTQWSETEMQRAVDLLLDRGADLDASDAKYETPLCRASRVGNMLVAQYLVAKGAAVNTVQPHNQTSKYQSNETGSIEQDLFTLEHKDTIQAPNWTSVPQELSKLHSLRQANVESRSK